MPTLDQLESALEDVEDSLTEIDRAKQAFLKAVDAAVSDLCMALDDKFHPGVSLKGFYDGLAELLSDAVYDLESPLKDQKQDLEWALSAAEEGADLADYHARVA